MKKWFYVLLVLGVGMVLFGLNKRVPEADVRVSANVDPEMNSISPLSEATNSDGSFRLEGESQRAREGRTSYSFRVVEVDKKVSLPIYSTVADPGSTMSIPRNSWSPDNKQIYLMAKSPGGDDYLVFRTDGSNYGDGEKYISLLEHWNKSERDENIIEVSGWAGDDLLMVYTQKRDGTTGSAYSFVTSTRRFSRVREF